MVQYQKLRTNHGKQLSTHVGRSAFGTTGSAISPNCAYAQAILTDIKLESVLKPISKVVLADPHTEAPVEEE